MFFAPLGLFWVEKNKDRWLIVRNLATVINFARTQQSADKRTERKGIGSSMKQGSLLTSPKSPGAMVSLFVDIVQSALWWARPAAINFARTGLTGNKAQKSNKNRSISGHGTAQPPSFALKNSLLPVLQSKL